MVSTCISQVRERKGRQRSRYGCRNCKLRKVKCDEGKPQCKRCASFGLLCNFVPNTSDLQPVAAATLQLSTTCKKTKIHCPVTNAIWTQDANTSYQYQLNTRCQDFITRYLGRSLINPHDPCMKQLNPKLLQLAFSYPYLMHASLAISLTYDRYLSSSLSPSSSTPPRTLEEQTHISSATTLFNARLSSPLPLAPEERDPMWATAAALVILTFSSPDACIADESWPLKVKERGGDLEWLRLCEGKMSLWDMVQPLRNDSIFAIMAPQFSIMSTRLPDIGITGMPPSLASLCVLNDESTKENKPYFEAGHALSLTLGLRDEDVSTGWVQVFVRCIEGGFKKLLEGRDKVALCLLLVWYRKVGRCVWWVGMRGQIEGSAIEVYLRRWFEDDEGVVGVLEAFGEGGL